MQKLIIYTLFLLLSCSKLSCQSDVKNGKSTFQEDKDWQELDQNKTRFFNNSEQEFAYENGTFWFQMTYEDKLYQKRLKQADHFLSNYEDSDHYFKVLKYYFNYLFEPRFLKDSLEPHRQELLDQKIQIPNGDKTLLYKQLRALPYDLQARADWIQKGDALVNRFLSTDATMEDKAKIEVALLGRDLRRAKVLYEYLYLSKKEQEAEFWMLFDTYFWKDLISRMQELILKYPNYQRWPQLIDNLIDVITESYLSPNLSETLWKTFLELTESEALQSRYEVIKQVHEKSRKNLIALKQLDNSGNTEPLNMVFHTINGNKIDLKDLRGKVVLLDFWSIRCAPCIKEMPHVQALYDKYKAQGFEVIGIASEGEQEMNRVLEITRRQGATWPQHLDKSADVSVSYHALYKIRSLPTVWLLDKQGRIVDTKARGARLEPLIRKYLELEK